MWHVKHLNGLTLVSVIEEHSAKALNYSSKNLRVSMCRSRCSSLVKDCPQYVQKTIVLPNEQQETRAAMSKEQLIENSNEMDIPKRNLRNKCGPEPRIVGLILRIMAASRRSERLQKRRTVGNLIFEQ
jgi:hypothetical protein